MPREFERTTAGPRTIYYRTVEGPRLFLFIYLLIHAFIYSCIYLSMEYVCVCVDIPLILDVELGDAPAGATQEEGHTGFLHLLSAVLALVFLARRIQPSLSLVDREVKFLCTHELFVLHLLGISFYFFFFFFFVRKNPSSCNCIEIRTHVPTSEGFEVTN